MLNSENDRKKRIEFHKNVIKEKLEATDISISYIQDIVSEATDTISSLNSAKENLEKELEIIENVENSTQYINDYAWSEYDGMITREANYSSAFSYFLQDTIDSYTDAQVISISAANMEVFTASGLCTTYTMVTQITDQTVLNRLQEIYVQDTLTYKINYIRNELGSIFPACLNEFENLINDWQLKEGLERHPVLLSLRSVIFYQIFETLCPDNVYQSSSWFQSNSISAYRGNPNGKRYCQSKCFILGNTNTSSLNASSLNNVEYVADSLFTDFGSLSEYGKNGGPKYCIDNTFRLTINDFVESIKLRKVYFS